MWHNLAAKVIDQHKLPVHVVYYEDYTSRYNETTRDLFAFLGLEQVHDPLQFIPGKTYEHFFDENEIQAITQLVWKVASPRTRDILHRYFQNRTTIAEFADLEVNAS